MKIVRPHFGDGVQPRPTALIRDEQRTCDDERNEPEVWEAKLGAMCDYAATGKWLLRHGAFPMLLIVTADLRILNLIRDVLAQTVAARNVPMPQVFVSSRAAIESRGPLSPIWKQAHNAGEDDFTYAFEALVK